MLKFVVCEDNNQGLEQLCRIITKVMMNYDIEYKIDKFSEYNKKFEAIINDEFVNKVYVLDIELPITSGLEIASQIRENDCHSPIVFVTAHSECKNDIFYSRLNAIDFISKYNRYQERLEETINYILEKMYRNNTLNFSYNHIYSKIMFREINYIEKAPLQNKCIIHLTNGEEKYITKSIVKLKSDLGPMFFQTHKSCVVNVENIRHIEYTKYIIHFKNGDKTNLLTPSARKELKKRVGDF